MLRRSKYWETQVRLETRDWIIPYDHNLICSVNLPSCVVKMQSSFPGRDELLISSIDISSLCCIFLFPFLFHWIVFVSHPRKLHFPNVEIALKIPNVACTNCNIKLQGNIWRNYTQLFCILYVCVHACRHTHTHFIIEN